MTSENGGLVAVALTRREARVWEGALGEDARPERFRSPSDEIRHHHVREAQHHHGHHGDPANVAFFESLTAAVADASEILLIGHGTGKANEMLLLVQYWERHHPDLARKVVGAVDSDLEAMTEREVLDLARHWFDEYHEFI